MIFLGACESENSALISPELPYAYVPPPYINDGWQVGHLADFGFDEVQINQLMVQIQNKTYPGIDSVSIVRRNTLVLHESFRSEFSIYDDWIGNKQLDKHLVHSTSKSFASALLGIAIQQGYIQSTEQKLLSFFDYQEFDNWDQLKNEITLNDVLTMQLGFEWDEWNFPFGDSRNSLTAATTGNDDFVKHMLDLPLDSTPGETYAYNTVASIALGAVVQNVTGIPLEDYAEQYLFEPLQIKDAQWLMTPEGYPNTGSGLFLFTRDMAKFGQLYLDRGVWNGFQVIESSWVDASLQKSVSLSWDYTSGYGFQWWLGEFQKGAESIPFYSARGFGGQFIVIVPSYDLVIAFTAHNYDNDLNDLPFKLIEEKILTAIN